MLFALIDKFCLDIYDLEFSAHTFCTFGHYWIDMLQRETNFKCWLWM